MAAARRPDTEPSWCSPARIETGGKDGRSVGHGRQHRLVPSPKTLKAPLKKFHLGPFDRKSCATRHELNRVLEAPSAEVKLREDIHEGEVALVGEAADVGLDNLHGEGPEGGHTGRGGRWDKG